MMRPATPAGAPRQWPIAWPMRRPQLTLRRCSSRSCWSGPAPKRTAHTSTTTSSSRGRNHPDRSGVGAIGTVGWVAGGSAAPLEIFRGRVTASVGWSLVHVGYEALGEGDHVDHLLHRLVRDLAPFLVRITLC